MTLSVRNHYFKGGIILAALSFSLTVLAGYFAFPFFPAALESAVLRSDGIIRIFIEDLEPVAIVPLFSILGAVLYSLVSIILIYYFFEKTQSPEILFIALFVISLSFEITRIMIPLRMAFQFSAIYPVTASRLLLFGRYFGLFSLFAAGVYASGLDVQKQQGTFFMLIMSSMIIALNIPVDSLVWDSSLRISSGYSTMFNFIEAGVLIITLLTFFISAYTRGTGAYIPIGIGSLLAYTGRNILLNSDTWITPLAGLLIMAAGTWLICTRLHRIYLWL